MNPGWRAWAALAVTLVIWASFLVVTRAAMTAKVGIAEVGLLRFGVGSLLYAPVLLRSGPIPKGCGWREMLLIPICGGFGFLVFLSFGLQRAPVADSGIFTPSMLPFHVAVLSYFFLGERFDRTRVAGLALIAAGALAVGGWEAIANAGDGRWLGHLAFSAASLSWAIYTIVFRKSGLKVTEGAAMMCFWSALAFVVLALVTGTDFASIPTRTLLIQGFFQGVLSGFLATFTFFYAVARIGAARTAAFAALVPVLAALGGWVVLGEPIGGAKAVGIVIVATGVALASGVLARKGGGG